MPDSDTPAPTPAVLGMFNAVRAGGNALDANGHLVPMLADAYREAGNEPAADFVGLVWRLMKAQYLPQDPDRVFWVTVAVGKKWWRTAVVQETDGRRKALWKWGCRVRSVGGAWAAEATPLKWNGRPSDRGPEPLLAVVEALEGALRDLDPTDDEVLEGAVTSTTEA